MSDFALKLTDLFLDWFLALFGFAILIVFGVWLIRGIGLHRRDRQRRIVRSALAAKMHYNAYAKIMDPVLPMSRVAKYENPLGSALEAANLGVITGGGTQMAKDGTIAWIGIDLALADLEEAIEFTRLKLRELGAPVGSVLNYRIGEQQMSVEII